ncbi:MAG TPA: hypothetical protein VJ960_09985 [Oceanipulchritudo sp.]|nr:hypothetical protein [Oceanipulchritudo sp.]
MAFNKKGKGSSRVLWVWVVLAFVILISAWTTLIIIAVRNQPERIEIQEP